MPAHDLTLISDAARAAGDISRAAFGQAIQSWDKGGGAGPVTEADLAVNAELHRILLGARPDYGWLSEETEDDAARLANGRVFVVDPIDGTRSFMEGGRDWGHSIAVVEGGFVIAAAVYMPMHDALYTASRGGGAFLNGAPITCAPCPGMEDAEILCAKPNLHADHWANGACPPFTRVFRSSLAYRLCLVARGRFHGMLTLRPTWEWDVAAGCLIVTEAGGHVVTPSGTAPDFNRAPPQLPGLVAGAKGLCDDLITALADPRGA